MITAAFDNTSETIAKSPIKTVAVRSSINENAKK